MTGSFQSTVNIELGFGVVGELFDDSPRIAAPWAVFTDDATQNVVGRAFTVRTSAPFDGSGSGYVRAGGTGVFAGILMNPKVYASPGTSADPLAPTLTLPNYTIAEFLTMGTINIAVPAGCSIGDRVAFDNTTGVLTTISPNFSGTGSITTTTLTISAQDAGNTGVLGVGSRVTGANVAPDTYITALGTGTGGVGTYTVNNSQTAASAAVQAATLAVAGTTIIPDSAIVRFAPSSSGIAVAQLNGRTS